MVTDVAPLEFDLRLERELRLIDREDMYGLDAATYSRQEHERCVAEGRRYKLERK